MHYDTWLTTHPDDMSPYGELVNRIELEPFEEAREWMEEVLKHLYETGDMEELEHALDELTAAWGISLPKGEMKVRGLQDKRDKKLDLGKEVYEMGVQLMRAQGVRL